VEIETKIQIEKCGPLRHRYICAVTIVITVGGFELNLSLNLNLNLILRVLHLSKSIFFVSDAPPAINL